ncbi:anti-sigma factor family protein [Oricola sp.]|uniref:anti-sigma factor family protein n=1 Tax=Oricola sp. TaxID=1979950 RepID=UPI003BAD5BE4
MTEQPDNSVSEDELHAYVDGALPEARRKTVEAWLAAHPDRAADVAAWQAQNAAIRSAFAAPDNAEPEEADLKLVRDASRVTRRRIPLGIAAGFALFFLAGGGAGSLLTVALQGERETTVIAELLPAASSTNYLVYASEARHPVEVGADQEAHLVDWLGKRIGRRLTAPDLGAKGYALVGGRLVTFAAKPGAMLMYEDAAGTRVTVLVGVNPEHSGTEFTFEETDGVSTFFWADGDFGYALSGAVDRETLLGLAHIVYVGN